MVVPVKAAPLSHSPLSVSAPISDPTGTERAQDIDLAATRRFGAMVGKVDDLALPLALYCCVRCVDKTVQALRQPVVAARLPALAVHALLHDGPMPILRHDEPV